MSSILQFFSGSAKIPAAGFDKVPKIYFTNTNQLPWASTCDLSITFPRNMGLLTEEEFRQKIDLARVALAQFKTLSVLVHSTLILISLPVTV